ncbi:MAG: hydantoinase/oxoprolinase family protein [Proteobacteria bacterium]|nr:hydantoinase/oxoprolinase family protein [Pseudomonadota bacterium]
MAEPLKLAADIGGTFTDIVLEQGSKRWSGKLLTTTQAPEIAVLEGAASLIAEAGFKPKDVDVFIHGTTLATNALIERKGAVTAFITTEGFRDVIEQGYEKRFDHYDLNIDRATPLVPRHLRLTVQERLAANGDVLIPLNEHHIAGLAETIRRENAGAVAIGFLHAYAHDAHEKRVRDLLQPLLPEGVTICISSEVAPEIREYERFSTTVANAYVRPLMAGYLERLQVGLEQMGLNAPLYLMMSGGGLTTLETAARFPIRLVESGPAGGAILASRIAQQCKLPEVLSFDMGGTTAKICLLSHGEPERAHRFEIARAYRDMKGSGIPVRIPVIEMVEIGAGGGSIARVDKLGRLTVGPDSAGSTPGPVAYGRGGTMPTVTDANINLGKIEPSFFAGGKIPLREDDCAAALARVIGEPLKLEGQWAAAGVAEIVEENMANAARVHAIERGKDIAGCTMIAFGGGAPLHACRLAEKVGISHIIVPKGAGVGSAIGFLQAPIAYEITKSAIVSLDDFDATRVNALISQMIHDATAVVKRALGKAKPQVRIVADGRYVGQGHEIQIAIPGRTLTARDGKVLKAAFEKAYETVYNLTIPGQQAEITTWSVTVSSTVRAPAPAKRAGKRKGPAPLHVRKVHDAGAGKALPTPVYWRFDLPPGTTLKGPAIIAEHETSTIVTPRFSVTIDSVGYIHLERQS